MTYRVLPRSIVRTTVVNGRSVSASAAFSDVADHDAVILGANGWTLAGPVFTTSGRPVNPPPDFRAIDSTLNVAIVYDGAQSRNLATGAIV